MEISVRTRLETAYEIKLDLCIENMDIKNLPSFSIDEIRAMVLPQVERLFLNNGGGEKGSKTLSRLMVYGKERCRELFPELFDSQEDPHSSPQ